MTARRRNPGARFATALSVAALVSSLVAGCGGEGGPRPAGPLTALSGSGGVSVFVPSDAGDTWPVTFGSLLLCSTEPVTLTKVVPHYKVGTPVSIEFLVRVAPAAAQRRGSARAWMPIGSATASPAQLHQAERLGYTSLVQADGTRVDQPCGRHFDEDASFTEIVTAVTSDAGGVWIDHMDVEYIADGEHYSLPYDWAYVACGDLITDRDVC